MKAPLVCLLSLASVFLIPHVAKAEVPSPIKFREGLKISGEDAVVAEGFVWHAVEFAEKLTAERVAAKCAESPESFAWVDFRYLNCLNIAYELTGETRYLDLLKDRFQLYRGIMRTGDDSFLGWYGAPIKARVQKEHPDRQIDELQMTFRGIEMLANWVNLARENEVYAAANAETIAAYLALMEEHLFPKWDARGYYKELPQGRGGVYHGLDFPAPEGVTLSHEKHSILVAGLLSLYRATGKELYLRRAVSVGHWFKSCLSLKDGHYEWMSWCPAGAWDVAQDKEDGWRPGWIAPDPNGPWYEASVSIAVNLYRHGLVFTEEDIARFVRTQKEMCWNGDFEAPAWRNVAGATDEKWIKGRFLSPMLAPYDETVRKLAFEGVLAAEAVKNAGNSWKGGANAQDLVRENYVVAGKTRPYAAVGAAFLGKTENRAWYEGLRAGDGTGTPSKPSEAGFLK